MTKLVFSTNNRHILQGFADVVSVAFLLLLLLVSSPSISRAGLPQQQPSPPRDTAAEIIELRKQILKLQEEGRVNEVVQLMVKARQLEEEEISHYSMLVQDASERGEWQSAVISARKILQFRERLDGKDSPTLVLTLSNLIYFYTAAGDYVRADYYLQRLLPFVENLTANPPNNPGLAKIFHNIGGAFASRGQYERAQVFYKALLRIRENDRESLDYVNALNGNAVLHNNMKDSKGAEAYLNQALEILEAKKKFVASLQRIVNADVSKPLDVALANILNSLASIQHANGNYDLASRNYLRAIELADSVFGRDSITASAYRQNLAVLRKDEKKYDEAATLFQEVKVVIERKLGPKHLETAKVDGNLAMLYLAQNDVAKALPFLTSNLEISEYNWSLNLSIGSESQKNLYAKLLNGYVDSVISFHTRFAPANQNALRLSLTTILRRKGRQLDVMADTLRTLRARASAEDVAKFNQVQSLRSQLAELVLRARDAAEPDGFTKRIASLSDQVERLESELSQKYVEYRLATTATTIEDVQRLIPEGAALVEIVSYRPINPKASVYNTDSRWAPPQYVAYILRHQGEPEWVELKTKGSVIDNAVSDLGDGLKSQKPQPEVRALAKTVYDQVFAPIAGKLRNETEILISPDGDLNLIPFAALVDRQNQFLVEKYSFTYLTSGRDLLRLNVQAQPAGPPVIVADPVFEQRQADPATANNNESVGRVSSDFHQEFDPLPDTANEATEVAKLLKGAAVLTDKAATETAVKRVSRPSLLHISTHGFFLADQSPGAPPSSLETSALEPGLAIAENPLLRSGLALNGANQLSGGNGEDGILTAYEIAGLDLRGTRLVVLSACETGLGGLQNGEGVYGLRRALLLAGAESEVVTLWRVNSQATTRLIEKYYQRLACGEGRSRALQNVQIEMLNQHPYFWAGFIPIGQWTRIPDGTFRPGAACRP